MAEGLGTDGAYSAIMNTKQQKPATDEQATDEILESNPGLLWRIVIAKAIHGLAAYARSTESGWDVFLLGGESERVLTFSADEFAERWEVVRWTTPMSSAAIDQILFARCGRMVVV